MVVVIPDTHAQNPDTTPRTVIGREQALEKPEKISASIHYLYVTTGSKDPVTGPRTKEFVARLDELKISYAFEQYPDQIHSMEGWRPSLNKFIAKLFR
jgi:enterochelin esterase-like enzyme